MHGSKFDSEVGQAQLEEAVTAVIHMGSAESYDYLSTPQVRLELDAVSVAVAGFAAVEPEFVAVVADFVDSIVQDIVAPIPRCG